MMPGIGTRHGWLLLALWACCVPAGGRELPAGLWLLPRKDPGNTARADVPGNMKAPPREVWSYGYLPDSYAYAQPVRVGGKEAFFVQVRNGVQLVRPDGSIAWRQPMLGVSTVLELLQLQGRPMALVQLGSSGLALLEAASGRIAWRWQAPPGAGLGELSVKLVRLGDRVRLVIFPHGPTATTGCCFELGAGAPRLVWQQDYQGRYWPNFGPTIAAADMDGDGRPEVVVAGKPAYVGVVDLDTGAVKFELRYPVAGGEPEIGRPYGLVQAADVDGDGYRDVVVVSYQVEQYLAVLRNQGGKGLALAWSQYVGATYPVGSRELRADPSSLADVNGDGKLELVVGLYGASGDERWHTVVFDTLGGYQARLADLPGRYCWGCRDLNGDGRPEIITTPTQERACTFPATVQAVEGKGFEEVAALEGASLVLLAGRLPEQVGFAASRAAPLWVEGAGGTGLLVSRQGQEQLWRLEGGKPVLQPFAASWLSRLVLFSQGGGRMARADLAVRQPPSRQPAVAASGPLVAVANGRRELILSLSDGTIIGGPPDLSQPGKFLASWRVRGVMPAAWIGPGGERIVCAVEPSPTGISLYQPTAGEEQAAPVARFAAALPVRLAGLPRSTAQLIPCGDGQMRLFVGMTPGHYPYACGVYDASGQLLWLDRENGPNPRSAAAGDLDGDQQEEFVVDYMGRHLFYDHQGQGRLVAHGWNDTIPGRGDGAKYALPIIGPFGPEGAVGVVMSPGLDALETLDGKGERLVRRAYASCYEFDWCSAAVGQVREGSWEVGMVNGEGIFHCASAATCRSRWTLDLGVRATAPISVAAGDLDGDGRDNFLVGLPNGELVALDERGGKGCVLWKLAFPAAVRVAIIADLDGVGLAEVVVELDNGQVKVLKGSGL